MSIVLTSLLALTDSVPESEKKPTRWNTVKAFDRVGLLANGPPGTAALPFI